LNQQSDCNRRYTTDIAIRNAMLAGAYFEGIVGKHDDSLVSAGSGRDG